MRSSLRPTPAQVSIPLERRILSYSPTVETRARARHARERLLFTKKQDAETRVCLVYPNRYAVGMCAVS